MYIIFSHATYFTTVVVNQEIQEEQMYIDEWITIKKKYHSKDKGPA